MKRVMAHLKMGHHRPLFRLFSVFFKQTVYFLQQINEKNVHPVYSTGIQTHDLQNVSLIPSPLDQGSPWQEFKLLLYF